MPSGGFKREKIERFVFLQCAAECGASLHARVSGICNRAEGVHCLKVPVA